ncbi:MAG: winged helix-turn-helix domain-containing protein [Chitinispirillaceae bacterium]|nr:winged helix-turn-helix domain-containing protein [Chitinispirillaceae bacterium]
MKLCRCHVKIRHLIDKQELIAYKCSEQIKLPSALWAHKTVKELINHQFGTILSIRTVGEYLKCWDFTQHKPFIRAYEQKP